jgi:hypothetical protein
VFEGHAFIVEAAVSVGGRNLKQGINIYRWGPFMGGVGTGGWGGPNQRLWAPARALVLLTTAHACPAPPNPKPLSPTQHMRNPAPQGLPTASRCCLRPATT